MSSSLRTVVQKTQIVSANETNLERGRIFTFTLGAMVNTSLWPGNFCWISPGAGCVVLDVWGAAGSSSSACCCGYGLPGNPGAYARRCLTVIAGCYICGCLGAACRNLSTFRGCSDPTALCWFGNGTNGCMCVQGGAGGRTVCHTTNSIFCCFVALQGTCNTIVGTGCGFICNQVSGGWVAAAFGGNINCSGGISCVYFGHCNSCCMCNHCHYVKISPGVKSTGENTVVFGLDFNGIQAPGITHQAMMSALSSASRTPAALPYNACWASASACACFDAYACTPHFGVGVPGGPTVGFQSNRDFGMMGAQGMVRIQYIASS